MPDFDAIAARHAAEDPDRKVTSAAEVPPTYDSITPDWLTDVLCRNVPGARVTGLALDARDDGTSNRRRILLTYNAAGDAAHMPPSVFCKAADLLQNRLSMASSGISKIEPDFYNFARPHVDLEAPIAYYAGFDPERYTYLVMFHDLTGRVTFCDEQTPVDWVRAQSLIETLARLHARFHQDARLGSAALPFLPWHDYWRNLMKAVPDFEQSCDRAFCDSETLMEPRLFRRRAEIWPATAHSVERHRELPRTLTHGDVHLKNWYLTPDNVMGLSDWQAVTAAHWSRDLVYALVTALAVDDRRRWEKDLIRLYIDRMAYHGVPGIDENDTWINCRQQIFTALAFWTITFRPAKGMPDMQPERTTLAFLRRLYAAVDDYDALDSFR